MVYRVKIKENEEPQNLITVSASDQDLGKNAVISYNISQGMFISENIVLHFS